MKVPRRPLTEALESGPAWVFNLFAIAVSFSTYFCMYAFRKPFAAAQYAGESWFQSDLELKTALVISQIIGYTISKYIGIKVCSEIPRARRAFFLVILILSAEAALILSGILPGEAKALALFLNGLPLGMVWGMVVWYLEGRRTSELLLAGLSCSFIVSSGMVKDVGRWLIGNGISEGWMPAVTGLIFLPLFLLSVWLLDQIPQPTPDDIAARHERETMNAGQRHSFVREFFWGLLPLLVVYFFLTAYRDFRDNYAVEIVTELGYGELPAVLTRTELPVAFGVLVPLALLMLIRNNRKGLIGAYVIMTIGLVMIAASTLLLARNQITGLTWMILTGLGSYLAYVPFGSVLFDRLMATTRVAGTAVFAIYLADAIGYTGSVGVQVYKDIAQTDVTRLEFFRQFTLQLGTVGALLLVISCLVFLSRSAKLGSGTETRPTAP